jgi:hypothetical protein
VGLELEDNPFDYKVCPKKKQGKKTNIFFLSMFVHSYQGGLGSL